MPKRKTEAEHARDRIYGEETTGATIEYPDGTVKKNGVVTKVGSRAIMSEDGKILLGFKPAENSDQ